MDLFKKHKNAILIGIIIIFLIIRIITIFTSHKHVEGDRAFTGIVAKHIIEKNIYPFYLYEEHYSGNQTILAYLLVIPFLLFGITSFSILLVDIILALVFLLVTYVVVNKIFSKKIALITSLLLAIPIPVQLFLDVEGGAYTISLLFNVVLLYLFYQLFYHKKSKLKNFALFGFVAAIAYYSSEFVLPLLIVCLIFWFIFDKTFYLTKKFFVFLISFIAGAMPIIIYNITNNFANIKQFLAGTIIHRFACSHNLFPKTVQFGSRIVDPCRIFSETSPSTFKTVFSKTFLKFFGYTDIAWIYYIIFVLSFILLAYLLRKEIKNLFLGLIPSKKFDMPPEKIKKELFIVAFIFIFIILFLISGFSAEDHLAPIIPFVQIMIALLFARLANKKLNFLAYFLVISIIVISSYEDFNFISQPNREDMSDVVLFLKENNIKYVYAPFFPKWKIIFGTNEEVIASCQDLCPCGYNYPPYEKMVADSNTTTYIFDRGAKLNSMLTESLKKQSIGYRAVEFKNQVVYQLEKPVKPNKIIAECKDSDGWPGEY